jgi:hypothetical protein
MLNIHSYNEKLDDLYRSKWLEICKNCRWKSQTLPFAIHGIVDEEAYKKQPVKIVFIGQEPNFSGEIDECFRESDFLFAYIELIRSQTDTIEKLDEKIFRRVGLMSYLIHTNYIRNIFPSVEEVGFPNKDNPRSLENARQGLIRIGYTNLKKCGGVGDVDLVKVEKCARVSSDLLKKELEIMEPNLVLCASAVLDIVCHNLNLMQREVSIRDTISGKSERRYQYTLWKSDNRTTLFVDFDHPSFRVKGGYQTFYGRFRNLFKELSKTDVYKQWSTSINLNG